MLRLKGVRRCLTTKRFYAFTRTSHPVLLIGVSKNKLCTFDLELVSHASNPFTDWMFAVTKPSKTSHYPRKHWMRHFRCQEWKMMHFKAAWTNRGRIPTDASYSLNLLASINFLALPISSMKMISRADQNPCTDVALLLYKDSYLNSATPLSYPYENYLIFLNA